MITFIAIKMHVEVNFDVKYIVQSVYKRFEICQSDVTYITLWSSDGRFVLLLSAQPSDDPFLPVK